MRVAGWQADLNRYLTEQQQRYDAVGYAPGTFDCCTFVADWVLRLTGEDPMAAYRGRYETEDEGFALLGGELRTVLTEIFGEPIVPAHAWRGDVTLIDELRLPGILFTVGGKMRSIAVGHGGFSVRRDREIARHGCCFAVR